MRPRIHIATQSAIILAMIVARAGARDLLDGAGDGRKDTGRTVAVVEGEKPGVAAAGAAARSTGDEDAAVAPGARSPAERPIATGPVGPAAPIRRPIDAGFLSNVRRNLFKPLLLFFYLGFLIPILRVEFEFPYAIYQGLTMYLLLSIGWRGGEELSALDPSILRGAVGFMIVGFATNLLVGVLTYYALAALTRLRRVDRATVAGYYGSDSAGTFVTCLGVLTTAGIAYDAYMPVMLAVMEIPGCLVALYLVSKLRTAGMDARGAMPDEPSHDPAARSSAPGDLSTRAILDEQELALQKTSGPRVVAPHSTRFPRLGLLHEVFLNPGIYLLFGGILIGYVGGLQGRDVTRDDDNLFNNLFQGLLCLFLLEMGITASRKLRDLSTAGLGYILFGLLAPVVFATLGMTIAHLYSRLSDIHFQPGTYVLFAVLCGSASYIAVPAVQRLAIPEASPTLPLAASLGLTFSFNVTFGIPIYMQITAALGRAFGTETMMAT